MSTFWSALEKMPGLNAIPMAWTRLMGPEFAALKPSFFRKQPEPAKVCFCEKCCCAHEVARRSPDLSEPVAHEMAVLARAGLPSLAAVCRCEGGGCPDIPVTPADIEIWELSWSSLGRALCRALELEPRFDELPLYSTCQIGAWSAEAVPVFLSIQSEPEDFRSAIAELVARLQSPFLLFAPTAAHLSANCRELLTHARAGFFPLDSTVVFTGNSTLRTVKPPGELFAALRSRLNAAGLAAPSSSAEPPTVASYALTREPGCWRLTFEGGQTTLEHEMGLLYVGYLLIHPRVPVAAAWLAGKFHTGLGRRNNLTPIPDAAGGFMLPDDASIVEEPPVQVGDSQTLRELRREHAELVAVLEDARAPEAEKAEAQRDLDRNEQLQHQYLGRFQDTAQKAGHAMRKSIYRLLETLRTAPRGQTAPQPLCLRFADHLQEYLIAPSRRYTGRRARIARADLAGCLTYEPPPGVVWGEGLN